jgi:hypothetical protein
VISAVVSDIKKTPAEAKLDNPLAVAGPIHANPISSVPRIIA